MFWPPFLARFGGRRERAVVTGGESRGAKKKEKKGIQFFRKPLFWPSLHKQPGPFVGPIVHFFPPRPQFSSPSPQQQQQPESPTDRPKKMARRAQQHAVASKRTKRTDKNDKDSVKRRHRKKPGTLRERELTRAQNRLGFFQQTVFRRAIRQKATQINSKASFTKGALSVFRQAIERKLIDALVVACHIAASSGRSTVTGADFKTGRALGCSRIDTLKYREIESARVQAAGRYDVGLLSL